MSSDPVALAAIADAGAVLDLLAEFAETIDFTDGVAAATTSIGTVTISEVAGLSILSDIASAEGNLATLVATPSDLASTVITLIQNFQDASVDFRKIADAANDITWASAMPAAGGGYGDIVANRTALANLVSLQALIEAVRAATATTYDSQDDAIAMRDDLSSRLDTAMSSISDRTLRASLDTLRVAMVLDFNNRAAALPDLETYTIGRALPALVLAYTLYDDPRRASDICARNDVEHPGFVPASTLTVLAS